MVITIGSILEKQKLEVQQSIDRMRAVLAKEERILAEINAMLNEMSPDIYASKITPAEHTAFEPSKSSGPRGLIKRAVLEVLEAYPRGLDALSILSKINEKSKKPYERTSLSPQLSRLKDDGYVILTGKIWKLKKFEAADLNPAKEESTASISTQRDQ